jgi:hypothetical protein
MSAGAIQLAHAEPEVADCPSCGQRFAGPYCHICGEKRLHDHELSLGHFIRHSFHEITHLDISKIPRTLWALLSKPGFLTEGYLAGRRRRFVSPIRLAAILLPLSLFLFTHFKQAAVFDLSFLIDLDQSGQMAQKIDRAAAKRHLTREAVIEAVNVRYQKYMSWAQVGNLVVMALALHLMYLRAGRYLVEHVVFSLHYVSFIALTNVLLWPLVMWLTMKHPATRVVSTVIGLGWMVYVFLALKRFYRQSIGWTAAKAVVLQAGYFVVSIVLMFSALIGGIVTGLRR